MGTRHNPHKMTNTQVPSGGCAMREKSQPRGSIKLVTEEVLRVTSKTMGPSLA